MKKFLKICFTFVFVTLISVLGLSDVYAASNMTITSKTYVQTKFSDGTYRKEAKFGTNKGTAYCITPSKTGGPKGTTLTYTNSVTSGSTLYLLQKAGSSNDSYLITQLAIWKLNNNFIPAAYNKNSSIVNKATSLANEAKKQSKYSSSPSMKVSTTKLTFTESSDGKYYTSNAVTVTIASVSKTTVSVSGAKGAIINVNGKDSGSSTTLSKTSKLIIKVPASNVSSKTTVNVSVKATGTKLSYERYSGGKWQDLIVLVKTPKTISASLSGTITPVVRKCQYVNGKYYDKDGKETTKENYSIQCEKHTCEKVGDKYFGKNGTIVSAEQYDSECNKHTCEKVGDKFYGKNGTVVSEEQYDSECNKHTCEKVGDKFFGKEGTTVTEEQYDLECNKHTCEKVGDKFFGKEGTIVTEEEYDSECNKHTCEKVGDKFYGKNGTVVSEEQYDSECNKHTCEIVNGNYFGKDGSTITADQYDLECNKHTCEIVNGNYFDASGNKTDEATYKSQCEKTIVPVPDTGSTDGLVYTVLGISLIGLTFVGIKNYRKSI